MKFWQIIGQWVLPILSIISAIVCVCVLCKVAPRQLGFDYMGVIVAVLGAIITFLVGWQIYQFVNFNRLIEKKIEPITQSFEANTNELKTRNLAIKYEITARILFTQRRYIDSLMAVGKCLPEYIKIEESSYIEINQVLANICRIINILQINKNTSAVNIQNISIMKLNIHKILPTNDFENKDTKRKYEHIITLLKKRLMNIDRPPTKEESEEIENFIKISFGEHYL